MNIFTQPVTPAVKAHMDAQFSLITDMSQKLFDTAQKINELNIQVAQTVMEETITSAQQLLVARDPYEAISIASSQAQPTAEKVRAYQHHLSSIAAGTQVELARTAESHLSETTRTAAAMADEVARRASEETEKTTQRQRAAMEKLTRPINKPADGATQAAARKSA
jgi:phasin family protein